MIVGGGPAGCALAQKLDDAIVLEEHGRIGEPVQCAGLVGENVFRLGASRKSIVNVIDGARIFFGEDSFLIRKPSVAYVIDRAAFDRSFSEGVDVRYGTKYVRHKEGRKKIDVETNKDVFTCEYLVGADGPFSILGKIVGITPAFYPAMQYTVKGEFEKNLVHLYIKKPFFYYLIPEEESVARVGCILPQPKRCLDSFLEKMRIGKIISKTAGVIPLGMGRTVKGRVALLGDAACQVKPLTGGGLFFGLSAARHLAEALHHDEIELYEKLWRRDFGWDIRAGLLVRKLYERMTEDEIGKAYAILKKNHYLLERCDFDKHTTFIKILLSSNDMPSLFPLALRLLFR